MKSYFLKQIILNVRLIIFIILTIFISSCSNDDTDINDNDTNPKDNYYVKYVIKSNSTYGRFSNWTATTPQGIYNNKGYQIRNWEQTYGPINKGFKCEIQIGDYISGVPTLEIYISKNSEPFALKMIKTGKSASYIIN